MSEPTTYVGIDAHKVELHVALLAPDKTEPVTWTVRNEVRAVEWLRRKLERAAPGPVSCCYEAGPCGYALQRQLEGGRVQCQVIAPALVPRKPGERIKTDRRDARKLAELYRAGLLTVVQAPTPAEEAVRDRGGRASRASRGAPAPNGRDPAPRRMAQERAAGSKACGQQVPGPPERLG